MGGGVGIECWVVVLLFVGERGPIDEVDLHSYAVKYERIKSTGPMAGSVGKNKSQFTAGIGYSGSSFYLMSLMVTQNGS